MCIRDRYKGRYTVVTDEFTTYKRHASRGLLAEIDTLWNNIWITNDLINKDSQTLGYVGNLQNQQPEADCDVKYTDNIMGLVSGANVNFDRLRHISERAEVGEAREKILGVGLEEKPGSFLKFSRNLGSRAVTEFNYRLGDATRANVYVGIEVESGIDAENLFEDLKIKGYSITDLTENEAAKVHLRHMVGGKPKTPISEAVFRFEFPERKGALLKFLKNIGNEWDITLFHYRNHGAAWGRVLVGFAVQGKPIDELRKHLVKVGYRYWEETHNEGYNLFLR